MLPQVLLTVFSLELQDINDDVCEEKRGQH